jgi:hypothetical protein
MKYSEIIDRIKNLDKSEIKIVDGRGKTYSKISLLYKNVRILDLTRPQFEKLKKLEYNCETIMY